MLGRTADDLYWLSRYVERAENMARLVGAGYRIAMMPRNLEEHREQWRSTLVSAACTSGFERKYEEYSTENVVNFLLLDQENPSSVYSCLTTARNKARTVRTTMTKDMWESLNSTWLELSDISSRGVAPNLLPGFLDWVKQRSQVFRGALLGTILRNDTFFFSQLGAFIERADNTARILDVKYYILLPERETIGGGIDNYQWATILRSVSAHRAYRWVYHEGYKPWRIAEFLILAKEMPRSLAFCYNMIGNSLTDLLGAYCVEHDCLATARGTRVLLEENDMDAIFQRGLHEFLMEFLSRNNQLSEEISRDFHFHD